MEWIVGLLTLTLLEIVLGIDNIIFISILAAKLPVEQRPKARIAGLGLALISRIIFLLSITWIMKLTSPLFTIVAIKFTGKSIILLAGGLFLIAKATHEIHDKLEGEEGRTSRHTAASFWSVVSQIVLIDIVFSIDSVITAVGMVDKVAIMITAVVISMGFMLAFAGKLADFVEEHPTIKMLALAFLVLIGANLVAEGLGQHIPKGYTYFAMAFSVAVEMLNIRLRKKAKPVHLHQPVTEEDQSTAASM